MTSRTLLAAAVALALAAPAAADTLNVPSDDHPTIQSAVTAAQEGDTIQIRGGPFAENVQRLDLPANVTIKGVRNPVIDAGQSGFGLELANGADLTITGLTITNSNQDGISLDTCANATITRCTVTQIAGDAIFVRGSPGLTVERVKIEDVQGDGVLFEEYDFEPAPALFRNNRFSGCEGWAIRTQGADGVRVERNRIENGGNGIGVTQYIGNSGVDATVSRNRLTDLTGQGILLGTDESTAERNGLIRVAGVGIQLTGHDSFCTRNKVVEHGTEAAVHNTGQRNQLARNKLVRLGGVGFFEEGSGSLYERNSVILAGDHAFEVESFGGGTFVRNKSVRNQNGDAFRIDQGGNLFEGNSVNRGAGDGFNCGSPMNQFRSNRVTRVDGAGFRVRDQGDNSFGKNAATRCEVGFRVSTSGNLFEGDRASRNTEWDLRDTAGPLANTYTDTRFKTESIEAQVE